MSLLTVLNQVCDVIKLPRADSAINSTDANISQLLSLAKEVCKDLVKDYNFVELQKEYTITLVDGVDAYALPKDIKRLIYSTIYNKNENTPILGSLSPQEWQARKSGLLSTSFRNEFRIKGQTSTQLFLNPTPTASEAGQIISFEYDSASCIRPRSWSQGIYFNAGSYCWSNNSLYYTVNGGTTGSTAPTGTGTNIYDGLVYWNYSLDCYDIFVNDYDEFILDPHYLYLGLKYKFYKENKLEYASAEAEYINYVRSTAFNKSGSEILDLTNSYDYRFDIDLLRLPDTGYGGV